MDMVCHFGQKKFWPTIFIVPDWIGCTDYLHCDTMGVSNSVVPETYRLILQMKRLKVLEVLPSLLCSLLAFSVQQSEGLYLPYKRLSCRTSQNANMFTKKKSFAVNHVIICDGKEVALGSAMKDREEFFHLVPQT